MTPAADVPPVDPRVTELLADLPSDLFTPQAFRSWELVDRYGTELVIDLAHRLDLANHLDRPRSRDEVAQAAGFVPAFGRALDFLLDVLTERGHLERLPGHVPRFRRATPWPTPRLAELRTACLGVDPSNHASLDLLDAAAAAYPAVGHGHTRGQEALFGLGHTKLWLAYFHNDNPVYGLNNRLAAFAAQQRLPARGGRILEVGAGAGSGTSALIERLRSQDRLEALARYHVTEPSPFFRRRAERELRHTYPSAPLTFSALDIDRKLADQGIEPGTYDLVYGVNVIHVARDLDAALAEIRGALAPGGWLVAAESIRPFPAKTISTELVFRILENFWDVETDPERRPTPGFLTPEQWSRLFVEAGFEAVQVIPDHARIREYYERFYAGVICGQAPG